MSEFILKALAIAQREIEEEAATLAAMKQREKDEMDAYMEKMLEWFPSEMHEYASIEKTGGYETIQLIFKLPNCAEFSAWKTLDGYGFKFNTGYVWEGPKFCSIERAIYIAHQNYLENRGGAQ